MRNKTWILKTMFVLFAITTAGCSSTSTDETEDPSTSTEDHALLDGEATTDEAPLTVPETTDQIASDQPVTDQPVTDQPVTDQPVTDQPLTDQTLTDPAPSEPALAESDVPKSVEPTPDLFVSENDPAPTSAPPPVRKISRKKPKIKKIAEPESLLADSSYQQPPVQQPEMTPAEPVQQQPIQQLNEQPLAAVSTPTPPPPAPPPVVEARPAQTESELKKYGIYAGIGALVLAAFWFIRRRKS